MATRTSSLANTPPPGTLARVLLELPKFKELSPQAQQNMGSAIRRFCDVLERGPDRVAADLRALEKLFNHTAPGVLGLSPARWRNIKSDVRRAVKLTGADRPVPDIKVPLTEAWEDLCKSGANPAERAVLRCLGRYCCARQIGPENVTDKAAQDLAQHLEERVLSKNPQRVFDDTIRTWNRRVANGELVHLTRMNRSCAYTLGWDDFRHRSSRTLTPGTRLARGRTRSIRTRQPRSDPRLSSNGIAWSAGWRPRSSSKVNRRRTWTGCVPCSRLRA